MKITYSNSIKDRKNYEAAKASCAADATIKLNEVKTSRDISMVLNTERKTAYTDKDFMERAQNVFSAESKMLADVKRCFNDFTLIVVG